MSQATAQLTSQRTAARLPRTRQQPRLRVITGEEVRRSHTGFVALCLALLTAGLLAVLLLNMALAEQSFALGNLQSTSNQLTDDQQQLQADLSDARAPQQLALEAQQMGMRPAPEVTYVRLSDGKVLGVAKNASAGTAFTVSTLPNTPASAVASKAVAAASHGIVIQKPVPTAPATTAPSAAGSPTASSTGSGAQDSTTSKSTTSKDSTGHASSAPTGQAKAPQRTLKSGTTTGSTPGSRPSSTR